MPQKTINWAPGALPRCPDNATGHSAAALTALTRRASLSPLFAPRPLCLPRGTNARQVFSAVAIERQYCAAPLEEATGFMGEATRDYAAKYNVRP